MQVINGTYVGQKSGGISSEALVQALLQGRGQAQSEYTRQAENQRTDKINLSNSFENEWAKFEDTLMASTSTPEGFAGAAQRYRAGLELRNQATGKTLTSADLDQLTAQWIQRVQSLHAYAGANQGQAEASQAAPPPGGASSGSGASAGVENVASGAKPLAPADPRGSVAYERATEGPVGAQVSRPAGMPSSVQPQFLGPLAPTPPAPSGSVPAVVMDKWILTFSSPAEAEAYAKSAGLRATNLQPSDLASAAQAGKQVKPMGATKVYDQGGTIPPAQPGQVQPIPMSLSGKTELVLPDAAAAARDPLAAVRQALGQGEPPTQQPSMGGGAVPVAAATQGISPIPPSLQVGTQQPLPMDRTVSAPGQPGMDQAPQGGFEKGQITLVPKSPKVEAVVTKAASTVTGLAAGAAKAVEMLQGLDSSKASKSDRRLQEYVVADHMHDILRNVSNVTNLPEYKAFLKSIDKKTSGNLTNATPEALIAIGMKDVGQAKLQRELTMAQIKASNRNLQMELSSRERIAALENEARYGSQMAQTTLTAAEIASKYIDSQASLVAAQEKAGKSVAQSYAENPKLWESQQIISKTYGVPLTAVPDLIKKGFFGIGKEYGFRQPSGSELTTYGQLNPAAGVTKSARGATYGTMPGAGQMQASTGAQVPAQAPVSAADFAKAALKSRGQ